ncbi:uncharacterized protein LOC112349416 [Selaginella moellendorffii]|nr:uncharacterized protein LOC112349416 [Selaginella moellendorffii]|eukprot:XP_024539592.1 uncharacterized protein LOC112349416 [Selaginella moellendorffii]
MAPWPIPWLGRLLWRSDPAGGDGDLAAIAESTRRFVTLLKAPAIQSTRAPPGLVYLLASEALSERSALDAAEVVRAIKPGAVVAQVGNGDLAGLRSEEESGKERIPTSSLAVIGACFLDSSQRKSFDSKAGVEVLRSIFGTTYHGPALSAKNAAREARCAFLFLETPSTGKNDAGKSDAGRIRFGQMVVTPEIAARVYDASSSFQGLSLCQSLRSGDEIVRHHGDSREFPAYASSFYALLVDLHDAYRELPGMNTALAHARSLLFDVEQGRPVDQTELAGAQKFRLAVEGLRIALAAAGSRSDSSTRRFRKAPKFEEMSGADQGDVLLAQALQEQARAHGSVVAVVDASSIAGIRRQWNTAVAPDVRDRARECFVVEFDKVGDDDGDENLEKKIVGSGGAVAVVGIASLPWWASATTPFTKVLVLKAPAFVKLGLVQIKRNATVVIAKSVTPLLTPGKAFSAVVKSAASAGKARAAAHSVVATAERATLSAIRTAFYCLMRKKQGMSSGGRPWLVLGGSVAAGAGILWSGDRLESAIEVAPAAPSVARLGRGLENLERASRSLSESQPQRVWEDLYKVLHK